MESNFENPMEFFVKNEPDNKNLFQFIHRGREFGYVTRSSQLIFIDLNF